MIENLNVYRCFCDKCGHEWRTKTRDVPRVCAKCHSVKWNERSDAMPREMRLADRVKGLRVADRLELFAEFETCCGMDRGCCVCEKRPVSEPLAASNDLSEFIAKAQARKGITQTIDVPSEPVNEWIGWSEPAQSNDEQMGEIRTYRRHIKTGRLRWLDAETATYSA